MNFNKFTGFCIGVATTTLVALSGSAIYAYSSNEGILSWTDALWMSVLIMTVLSMLAMLLIVWLGNRSMKEFQERKKELFKSDEKYLRPLLSLPTKETYYVETGVLMLPRLPISLTDIQYISLDKGAPDETPYVLYYIEQRGNEEVLSKLYISEREELIISTALKKYATSTSFKKYPSFSFKC